MQIRSALQEEQIARLQEPAYLLSSNTGYLNALNAQQFWLVRYNSLETLSSKRYL